MTVKLFQDVAGTIPAILAGQPVGFIKRAKGSDDAKQATALSKPTYARHPKTGVRNVVNGSASVGGATFYRDSGTSLGVVFSKIATAVDPSVGPIVRYNFSGLTSGSGIVAANVRPYARLPVVKGEVFTLSGWMRVISRVGDVGTVEFGYVEADATGRPLNYLGGASTALSEWQRVMVTRTAAQDGVAFIELNIGASGKAAGVALDMVIEVAGVQLEKGGSATPLQFNYSANDITETGIPDLWHLYNDGGDSLNVTLPAGTYGLASIGIDRQIIVTTFVSDGTTPVNILRHERQLNVSYRLGAYSAAEELAIRDHWGRKYA